MTTPAPYPADTRAKGWRFEIDTERIRQSDTWALASAEIRPWLLMLWMIAWEQTPCGSLPADDELIAARLGMPMETWGKHKRVLMRGWWTADDGRQYHQTLTERALEMMERRRKESDRKALARAKKLSSVPDGPASSPSESDGCPEDVPRDNDWTTKGFHPLSDTGTGTGTYTGHPSTPFPHAHTPPAEPSPGARAVFLMKSRGISEGNPGHPDLLALIEAGASDDEFLHAAKGAVDKGKGFTYALGILKSQRQQAASLVLHQGALPESAKPLTPAEVRILESCPHLASADVKRRAYLTNHPLAARIAPMEIIDVAPAPTAIAR